MKRTILFFTLCLGLAISAQGQKISASGQLGWIIPGGGGVDSTNYDVSGGINYAVDALYHLGEEGNLGVGLGYYAGILSGGLLSDNYGLTVVGVKALYMLNPEGFSPFAGLTIGAAKLATPEITINNVALPVNSASGLGLVPTVGLSFGGVYLALDYVIPTNYDIPEIERTGGVGGMIISLGYRRAFEF